MPADLQLPPADSFRSLALDNIDEIARAIRDEIRKHGGGRFCIDLARGGSLELEVTPDGGKGPTDVIAKVCADGRVAHTVTAKWPNGETMREVVHLPRFLRILPRFLREATTPKAMVEL